MTTASSDRRPLKARGARLFQRIASFLARCGVTPNQISVASVLFAAAGAAALLAGGWYLLLAAACIQGRLLCNLFDGMVAVEHGKATALGAVYNEFPDRIADSVLLVAAATFVGWWLAGAGAAAVAASSPTRAIFR